MSFSTCLVTMATILTIFYSKIGADIYHTSFRYQLHMQWLNTYVWGDLQLSHVNILNIFSQFDLYSLDLDLGQCHLNTFVIFDMGDLHEYSYESM